MSRSISLGDGVTTDFTLAVDPYFPATSKSTIISDTL